MLYISKSKYCLLWQCPKLLWLSKYKPECKTPDSSLEARFSNGNTIGDLAMGLFGDFTEVTAKNDDGSLNISEMIERTKKCMDEGAENICEASFSVGGLYCAVDILRKENDGWAIYEVKSSTHNKQIYAADIAFQKMVLKRCGVNVTGTYLVCINSDYMRGDELNIHELFKIIDVSKEVEDEIGKVPGLLKVAEQIYPFEKEPEIEIGTHCQDPYVCGFWDYCTKNLPKPNVFDLYRIDFKKALDLTRRNKADFGELLYSGEITNPKQLRQMLYATSDQPDHIDREKIRKFLGNLSYPLYFLDYETMQPAIPEFKNTHPYEQIPFQYSLHYIEREGGPLLHKEFLAESGTDPRRAIAEALCRDIPMNVCVTAYNKTFECTRLKELAEFFPDLSEHLLNIRDNIVDLLVPFQSGYYYNKAMGGSFSIKSVLPALFPNDPELDYHNLDQIHNGGEAMTVFPQIKDMPPEEQEKTRHNLLEYCKLDTLAMVKLWEKLKEVTEDDKNE